MHYILDENNNPVQETDVIVWAKWIEKNHPSKVDATKIGSVFISTVFTGLDYGCLTSMKPVLWETMIFGGKFTHYRERYTSLELAKKGHKKAVRLVKWFGTEVTNED